MHRDYHAQNLLWRGDRSGLARVGMIDFQDALAGSPAYDLVSLLEDARRDVAPELANAMMDRYLARSRAHGAVLDEERFRAEAALLAAQRNAKIIGIFARLAKRDGKPRYLAHLPRVWRYMEQDLSHPGASAAEAVVRPQHSGRRARRPEYPRGSSSVSLPTRAMIMAAGLGTRMAPYTLERPKPLIALNGKPLIDHVIDRLVQGGVNFIVVNVHYKADQLIAHLEKRRARDKHVEIRISNETGAILDTGGGIAKALPAFRGRTVLHLQFGFGLGRGHGLGAGAHESAVESGDHGCADAACALRHRDRI